MIDWSNKEEVREHRKKYYIDNSEEIKERSSKYYISNKEKTKERSKQYRQTVHGKISTIYRTQKHRCIKKGFKKPQYTLEELKSWLFNKTNFIELYNNWVDSGYEMKIVPTIDRIDSKKGYFFGNIQVLTLSDNTKKQHWNNERPNFKKINSDTHRKFTDEQIIEIYILKGTISSRKLAKKYNVHFTTICNIWNKKVKYVEEGLKEGGVK